MLERYAGRPALDDKAYHNAMDTLEPQLSLLQRQCRAAKIPTVILVEGWGASGKGVLIAEIIKNLDPRGYKVWDVGPQTPQDKRFPWLHRFWRHIPRYGQMAILDRSWYLPVSVERVERKSARRLAGRRLNDILELERQLTDDGYVLIKFFLHIDQGEQQRRFEDLERNRATRWRVTKADWRHHRAYDRHYEAFDAMLEHTDRPWAPWTVLEAYDQRHMTCRAYETVVNALQEALAQRDVPPDTVPPIRESADIVLQPIPRLSEVDLSPVFPKADYPRALAERQQRLYILQNALYRKKIPLILAYEGWDAAGKGGNIHRLARGLDPRGYEVIPIAAPTDEEREHPFLWRFWTQLPPGGRIAVFDRTWYGRVLVERVEGLASPAQWRRAYDEINRFELQLAQWGAVILKFWLQIDRDEQLARFTQRQQTPEKQHKITDEDWRNRSRWDAYEAAADEMLMRTHTAWAPWVIVESNDKRFARIKTLDRVIEAVEKRLNME